MRQTLTLREVLRLLFIPLQSKEDTVFLYEILADDIDNIDRLIVEESGFVILDLYGMEKYVSYLDLEYFIIPQALFDRQTVIEEVRRIEIELLESELSQLEKKIATLDSNLDYWLDSYNLILKEIDLLV